MIKSDLEDIMLTVIEIINSAPCMPSEIKSRGGVCINTSEPRSVSLSISGIGNVRKINKYVGGCYMASWDFRLSYTSMCKSDDEKIHAQALMSYFTEWFEGAPTHDEFGVQTNERIVEYPKMSDSREMYSIRELRNPSVQEITKSGLSVISTEYKSKFISKNNNLWRQNA